MRQTLPPRGRRAQQVLAVGAAPALVAGLALVATSNPATASSTAAHQDASAQRHHVPYVSKSVPQRRTLGARLGGYWTPERMENAIPAGLFTLHELNTLPESQLRRLAESRSAARPTAADARRKKVHKSATIGKVFFKTRRGVGMVCSGSAVASKRKNMVMTAGHCVHGGKGRGWHRKWIFVPGYGPRHKKPNGVYGAKRIVALRGWVRHRRNFSDDVGLALVKPIRGTKKKLTKNVGGYGPQFRRNKHRRLAAVGYSDRGRRFKGGRQRHCRRWTHKVRRGQIQMRCHVLVQGASGGPWVRGKVRKGKGHINGVNSTINARGKVRWVRSPYFGRDVRRMYRAFRTKRG